MYVIWFLHRVPNDRESDFASLVGESIRLFRERGALGATLFKIADPAAKYGCTPIDGAVEVASGETLYAEITYFRDRAHYDELMPVIDQDPELLRLYDRLVTEFDVKRLVRGEFASVLHVVGDELSHSHDELAPAQAAT